MPSHDSDEFTTSVIPRGAVDRSVAVEVIVVDGPERGTRLRIDAGHARVGTAPTSTLRLTDATVSRLHCELLVDRDAIRIIDSGSTNGTFVDGVRVRDAELDGGSIVRIGSTALRIEVGERPVELQLSSRDRFGEVLGVSVEMRRLFSLMERVASTDSTVLIEGETGTGKELVARSIHEASRRASGPFIAVDCGAIAENLIESELFGHRRGSFSGAVTDREGLFEAAHGGTIFLDEIGELPRPLQPKLLRAIEAREVRRVGSNQATKIDVRVLAATNRSLASSVNDGSFREDLYFRLAVVELHVPPLRRRREDVPLLAAAFHERFTGEPLRLDAASLATLAARRWPGNVRELRNFVERSVSLGWGSTATSNAPRVAANAKVGEEAAIAVPTHLPLKEARVAWTEQFELHYVKALLARTKGNVTRAAELAGVNRRSLQRLMAQLGVRGASGNDDEG